MSLKEQGGAAKGSLKKRHCITWRQGTQRVLKWNLWKSTEMTNTCLPTPLVVCGLIWLGPGSVLSFGPCGDVVMEGGVILPYCFQVSGGCHCGFPPLLSNTLRDKVTYTDTQFRSAPPHTHTHKKTVDLCICAFSNFCVPVAVGFVFCCSSWQYGVWSLSNYSHRQTQSDTIIDEQLFLSVSSLVFIKQTGYLFTVHAVL